MSIVSLNSFCKSLQQTSIIPTLDCLHSTDIGPFLDFCVCQFSSVLDMNISSRLDFQIVFLNLLCLSVFFGLFWLIFFVVLFVRRKLVSSVLSAR